MAQTKIGELGAWLGRRDKTPRAAIGAISRAYWRWNHKYCLSKRVGVAPFFQIVTVGMIFFYSINSQRIGKY